MTIKVIEHKNPPPLVVIPPSNYDLTGLPLEAIMALKAFAYSIRINGESPAWAEHITDAINRQGLQYGLYFEFTNEKFNLRTLGEKK